MRVNESKKIGKISDELITYLIHNGYDNITYSINKDEHNLRVTLSIEDLTQEDEAYLKDTLDSQRSYDIEEYSWELLGESASNNELALVGMLFDSFHFERKGSISTITMKRILDRNK